MKKVNKIKLVFSLVLFIIGMILVILNILGKLSINLTAPAFLIITLICFYLWKDIPPKGK